MWETILTEAVNIGIWAALFVGLMIYFFRDTAKREEKYQGMIKQLHDCLSVVADIQKETKAITETLVMLNKDITEIKVKVGNVGGSKK